MTSDDAAKFREAIKDAHSMREKAGVSINGILYSMVKDRVELFRQTWGGR